MIPTPAAQADPAPEARWKRLELHASKLIFSAETEIELESPGPASARADLMASPKGKGVDASAAVRRISITTSAMGRKSTEEILFDGDSGTGLQRFKLRHGSKTYSKTYRFTNSGVFQLRASPKDVDEATGPRKQWSQKSETWFARPSDCEPLADASALLYLVSLPDWVSAGNPRHLCVFSSKAFSRARVEVAGEEISGVDYAVGDSQRKGEARLRKVVIKPEPLAGQEDEPFELMGLSGNLVILVDIEMGVPVEVRGKLSPGGSVTARLRRAELR